MRECVLRCSKQTNCQRPRPDQTPNHDKTPAQKYSETGSVPKPAQQRPDGKMTKLSCWGLVGVAGRRTIAPTRNLSTRYTAQTKNTKHSGKPNTATTAFARSRLPRSLLTAHSADADAGFVGVWGLRLGAGLFAFISIKLS